MKRIACLILIVIICFSSLSITAFAMEEPLYGTDPSATLSFEEILASIDKSNIDDTSAWIVGIIGILITIGGIYYYFIKKRNQKRNRY